jgi:uncharacterized membrane protein YcfT
MSKAARMAWVDMAKGLSIILVVMMYAAYNTGEYTGGVGFLHYVIGFATPFRMPEFFLISGLFLAQVIARPWRHYADRRVVHYFYFYIIWAIIMIALKVGIFAHAPVDMLRQLGLAVIEPYGVLWFIYMLGIFGVTAKLLWQWNVPAAIVIPVAALLQMAGVESSSYIVTQFAAYFAFFYVGYVAAPLVFRIVAWTNSHVAFALAGLTAWALSDALLVFSSGYAVLPDHTQMGLAVSPPLHFALAILGAVALCIMGGLLSKLAFMNWLRWLGEHSLVVYAAFTIPMSLFRAFALKTGLITDTGALSFAVLIVSVVTPVALYLLVQRIGYGRFLFERPAWARIAGDRPSVTAESLAIVPVPEAAGDKPLETPAE